MRAVWVLGLGLVATIASACTSEENLAQSGCISCHRPAEEPVGIEIPHTQFALRCEDCHGGDPTALSKGDAHVPNPDGIRVIEDLAVEQMAELDQDYLRFLNPAHPRVVPESCGSGSPQAAAGAGCHQAIIDTVNLSVHTTAVGIATVPRFNANVQAARPPALGAVPTTNASFQSSTAPRFTYSGLNGVELASLAGADPSDPRPYLDHALTKGCMRCHLSVYGGGVDVGNDGLYRGVGCAACHMPYGVDGLSQSDGPLIDKSVPSHAEKHVLTRSPPDRACEACHHTSYRIGLSFKGWREAPGDLQMNLPRASRNEVVTYGRPPGSYIIDEDTDTEVDETPPDVHREAGMGCADCHTVDVHGDGHVRPNMGAAAGIECTDCHGTFDAPITEREGGFRTVDDVRIERLARDAGGQIQLTTVAGAVRSVPQVSALAPSEVLMQAHGEDHAQLECYACHTAWMQNIFRVDRTLDLREDAVDPIVGTETRGAVTESIRIATVDDFFLGLNVDGQVGTFMADHGVFSVIASCDPLTDTATCTVDRDSAEPGKYLVEDYLGESSEGRIGLDFRPAFQHTVRGADGIQPCSACHPKRDGSNLAQVRAVYGFGTGQYTLEESSTGRTIDLTRMIDALGTSTVALGHLLPRPLEPERVEAALAAEVD